MKGTKYIKKRQVRYPKFEKRNILNVCNNRYTYMCRDVVMMYLLGVEIDIYLLNIFVWNEMANVNWGRIKHWASIASEMVASLFFLYGLSFVLYPTHLCFSLSLSLKLFPAHHSRRERKKRRPIPPNHPLFPFNHRLHSPR